MMIKGVVNQRLYNLGHSNRRGERNVKPSKTVPDATLSIQEIERRYARGADLKHFEPAFLGDDDSVVPVGIENLSKVDRFELSQTVKSDVQVLRGSIEQRQAARAAAESAALLAAAKEVPTE